MTTLSFSEQDVAHLTEKDIEALAERLETDSYKSAFDCLKDWHLLRAVAFQRPELAEPYYYLLDMEAFDES